MKFPYWVRHNGVDYAPNTEIPTEETASAPVEEKEEVVAVEEPVEEETKVEEPTYTKTEINRMPIVELRRLARKQGIKKAADKSGAELKVELIELLNL